MKLTSSLLFTCAVICARTGGVIADQNSGRLSLEADYSAFRIHDDSAGAFVEIHYNLNRSQLNFKPDESGYVAIIEFRLALKDSSGAILDTFEWRAGNRIETLSSLDQDGFLITDMVADYFPAGIYNVELIATNGDNFGRAAFYMDIPLFKPNGPLLSSIELAYKIQPDSAGRLVKNGLRVVPNPSHLFARHDRLVYFYAEAYGLDTSSTADSAFHVAREILDTDGNVVMTLPELIFQKPGESAIISSNFDIDSLGAGSYTIKVSLADGQAGVSSSQDFSVTVPREFARQKMLQGILREFPESENIASREDAEKFRDEISYIASPAELKMYNSLPLEGKSQFQKDFWSRRDPDPSTSQNEFQVEHYKRIKYANSNFGRYQGGLPGWRSDRGRVLITYGEPSEIENFSPSAEARAWERWWFHGIEGGVYFIFVDQESSGDYNLVHSSKRDEIKDLNWEDKIKFLLDQR